MNIIQFTNKTKSCEDFDDGNKVVLHDTSTNIVSLVRTGKYGAINEADTTIICYYVVKYLTDNFKLQEDITINGQASKAVKLLVISEQHCIMKEKLVLTL